MHRITTWFGTFIIENDTILSCDLLKKDMKILADHLLSTPDALESSMVCGRSIRSLAKELGFVTSDKEYDDLFRDVNIEYAVQKVAASRSYDHVLIRSIEALDELDTVANMEEIVDYDLGYFLGLRVRTLETIIQETLQMYAPDIFDLVPFPLKF